MFKFLLIVLSIQLISSCSVKDKLDEMHKSTVEMNETTKEMAKNTENMSQTTKEMAVTTGHMANTTDDMNQGTNNLMTLLRAKEAEATRKDAFERIRMAKSFQYKAFNAAVYFMAFEFQLWTVTSADTDNMRERFYFNAVEEFFLTLYEFIHNVDMTANSIDPALNKTDKISDNSMLSLLAISVAMDRVNEHQLENNRLHPSYKIVNFYQLIESALLKLKRNSINLSDADQIVIEYEKEAIFLLQLRYNMFSTVALSKLTHIENKNLYLKAKMLLLKWNSPFQKLNEVQKDVVINNLVLANNTKKLLKLLGERPVLNKNIRKIWNKMRKEFSRNKSKKLKKFEGLVDSIKK